MKQVSFQCGYKMYAFVRKYTIANKPIKNWQLPIVYQQ